MIATRARPGRSKLVNERLSAVRRLQTLLSDADGMDRAGSDELDEIRAGVSSALARIAEIDAALADCEATSPLDELNLAQRQPASPHQQRAAARARLLTVLITLHDMPPSCVGATKLLRKAIHNELRTIERSRREEFDHASQ